MIIKQDWVIAKAVRATLSDFFFKFLYLTKFTHTHTHAHWENTGPVILFKRIPVIEKWILQRVKKFIKTNFLLKKNELFESWQLTFDEVPPLNKRSCVGGWDFGAFFRFMGLWEVRVWMMAEGQFWRKKGVLFYLFEIKTLVKSGADSYSIDFDF